MNVKPYDVGLFVTRGQIFHNGHRDAINIALEICDRVLVLIGSAQESGTIRNPFNYETRAEMIREVYGRFESAVIVRPLIDMTNEDDISTEWGDYLIKQVVGYVGKIPDVMIYGDDDCKGWFDNDVKFLRIVVPRAKNPISATGNRELMLRNRRTQWFENHPSKLHKHYDRLKGELLLTKPYSLALENLQKENKKMGWKDFSIEDRILPFGSLKFENQEWD